jgi:hypothetical protein
VALKAVLFPDAEMAAAKPNDYLALTTFGYVSLLWAGALLFLGGRFLRGFAFPAAFLVFMVPMPTVVENAVEVFFQHTSADATAVLFSLSGMTYYREGLVFELPGIALQVAQLSCSVPLPRYTGRIFAFSAAWPPPLHVPSSVLPPKRG